MTCPVCGCNEEPEFIKMHGGFRILRCTACSVVFSDPMKNPGAEWYERSEGYAVGKLRFMKASWFHRVFLEEPALYGESLLDVGCGTGLFLNEAGKKGYRTWGIDFDRENIRIARERYGLKNVYVMSIEDIAREFKDRRFDVVTFFEVLEHLDEPLEFLRKVKTVLKPGGYIALSVPNRRRTLDIHGIEDNPPHHLTKWDMDSLTGFLESNGFETVKRVVKTLDREDVAGVLKAKIDRKSVV